MFWGCESLTALDLSNFDTAEVTDMSGMFSFCKSLTALDLSNFDTAKVTDMSWMFFGCESLRTLDLSNFDTAKVTDMSWMFDGCESLTDLDPVEFRKFLWRIWGICSLIVRRWRRLRVLPSEIILLQTLCSTSAPPFKELRTLRRNTDARMANPESGYFSRH